MQVLSEEWSTALVNSINTNEKYAEAAKDWARRCATEEGMLVGIHSRENDLVVNPLKGKQLTNVRAAGKDDNILLTPALKLSLERALEFINDDELVEITPKAIRLRKKYRLEHERKRVTRQVEIA